MPIYRENRGELESLRKTNSCAVCGGTLSLFYDYDQHIAYLACSDYLRSQHEGIAREGRPFEENILTRRDRMVEEHGEDKARALIPHAQGALTTEKDAMKVLNTLWPNASRESQVKAAMICVQYELNPLMRHLFLIPFKKKEGDKWVEKWEPVMGIQASRLIAHRAGDFSYIDDTPRVMTEEEQVKVYGESLTDRICAITRLRDSKGNEAVGYGVYLKKDEPYGQDKGNTKANMAFIRSERQAMDRLFAGKMPSELGIVDAQYVEVEGVGQVDTTTGEIQDEETQDTEAVSEPEEKPKPGRKASRSQKEDAPAPEEPEPVEEEQQSLDIPSDTPPEMDESTISNEQHATLQKRMEKDNVTPAQLGEFCNTGKFGHTWGVKGTGSIKVWQYTIIMQAFNDGILHSGI